MLLRSSNDIVTICKQNGEKTEGIKADVFPNGIIIDVAPNQGMPVIETGDIIEHKQSNGVLEQYEVIDPSYYDDAVFGQHYQCKVEKLSAKRRPSTPNIYNINATQANIASDNATITARQTINIKQSSDIEELFLSLLAVAKENAFENQKAIESAIFEMKQAVGKPSFSGKYNAFIQSVANHITIFAPFIPQLTMLLPGLGS